MESEPKVKRSKSTRDSTDKSSKRKSGRRHSTTPVESKKQLNKSSSLSTITNDTNTASTSALGEIKQFKRVHNASPVNEDHLTISTSTSPTSGSSGGGQGSREKLIYTPYRDGFMNENKLPFDNVNFCFVCDQVDNDIILASTPIKVGTRTSALITSCTEPIITPKFRSRSSSEILTTTSSSAPLLELKTTRRKGLLKRCVERTGFRLSSEGFTPVYRVVFLCPACLIRTNDSKLKNTTDYCVEITTNALKYF